MAFTFKGLGGSAGLATTNASSVTLTTATTAGAENDLAVLLIAVDNAQTTDGDENAVTSVTDNSGAGNTWTKAGEFTNGQGTAQTGATVGIWYCDLKGAMAVGSVITVNFSNNTLRDAQGLSLAFFSTTRPDVALEGTPTTLANDAAAAGSMNGPTTSTSIEILRVRATASEANVSTVWTKTAAFDGLFTVGVSTGGTSTSKMGIRGEYEISTGNATLASAPTGGAGAVDNASLYACFKEIAGSFSAAATLAGAGGLALTQSLVQVQRVALATLAGAGGLTADATVVSPPSGGGGWTWNPSDKSANITLSGGDLVGTGTASADSSVRGTVSATGGKYYWEIVVTNSAGTIYLGFGLANASLPTNTWIGNGTNNDGVAFYRHVGAWDFGGSAHGVAPTVTTGDRLGFAWDAGNQRIWVTKDGSTWYGETNTGNPASGTGGLDYSPIDAGPYYPIQGIGNGDIVTLVPDAASWARTPPSGFGALTSSSKGLGVDGQGQANNASTASLAASLTTTTGSGVIVAVVTGNSSPTGVTASGLTFTQRSQSFFSGNYTTIYTAPYTSNFSGNITVTLSSAAYTTLMVFGVAGAATSNFFDTNASLPSVHNANAGTTPAFSTTNADDFIIFCGTPTSTGGGGISDVYSASDGSPVNKIFSQDYGFVAYTVASAAKSSVTFTNSSGYNGSIVDALVLAAAGTPVSATLAGAGGLTANATVSSPPSGIAFVTGAYLPSTTNGGFTSSAIDTTGANFLVIEINTVASQAGGVISDSKGNTWQYLSEQDDTVFHNRFTRLYYAENAITGTGHTFTCTGTNTFPGLALGAFSGVATSSALDVSNGNGNFGSFQTGSVTPSQANSLIVTGLVYGASSDATIDQGFTIGVMQSSTGLPASSTPGGLAYIIETSIVAKNPTWNPQGTNTSAAKIAVFKPAAAAGDPGGGIAPLIPYRRGQKKPWNSIPRINKDHPLAEGLLFYAYDAGGAIVDLVDGGLATYSSVTGWQSTPWGGALKWPSASSYGSIPESRGISALARTTPYSVAMGMVQSAAGNAGNVIVATGATDNSSNNNFGWVADNTTMSAVFDNATAVAYNKAISFNTFQSWGAAATGANAATMYVDGAFDRTTTAATTFSVANSQICFNSAAGNSQSFGGGLNGYLFYFAGWDRALTASEFRQLHDDPYCFLIYPEDEIFSLLVAPAAPAGPTSWAAEATFAGVGDLTANATVVTGGVTHQLSATFAGVGGLTANALVFKPATATFAGIGGLTAQSTQWVVASVTFAGIGGFTANALNTKPITATLAGAGNLTAQLTQVMQASATFAGVGGIVADLTPPGAQAYQITATLAGVGGFVANALVFKPLTATLAGVGSLTAVAQQVRPITATFAGIGGFTAQATQVVAASVTFAGVGSLTASSTQVMQASALFAGVGGISATLTPPGAQAYQISATLAGVGNLTAFASMTARVTATFAGVGSLTADGQITKPITATLAGAGSLTAQTTQRMAVTVTFAGAGGLTSQPTQLMRALAATFAGVGGMSADLTPPGAQTYQITATLAGIGSLTANALVFKPLTATLVGAGSLTAQTTQSMRALSTLAGAGGILANLTPPGAQTYQLTATLAGVGNLTANALVFKPISATFTGSGGLIVQESQRQVATATLSGAGNLIASSAQVMQASALFTGVGGMSASLTPPAAQIYQLEALLAGAGGLAGSVVQRLAVTAQLDGVGSLTASVSRQAASATALFAGAGNMTASLSQVMSARAATLGGTGGLTADPALVPSGSQAYALSAVLAGEGGLFADCGPPIKLGYQSPPGGIGEPPYRQLRPLYAEIECKIETGQSQGATGRLQQDVVFLLQTEQAPEGIVADAALDVSLVAAVRQLRGDVRLATRMAVASRGDARQATRGVDGTGGLRAELIVKSGGEAPAVPEYHGEPEFFQPLDTG